jgi:hypothetical protein
MRYRSFDQAGLAVSAITLTLDETPLSDADRRALVFAALEAGINSFQLDSRSSEWNAVLRAAIGAAGRQVLVLMLRASSAEIGQTSAGERGRRPAVTLRDRVHSCLDQVGIDRFDAVLLDDGPSAAQDRDRLHALRDQRLARMVGVTCGSRGPDLDIVGAGYDLVATPFGLHADASMRMRLRAVVERNIAVVGFDFFRPQVRPTAPAAARTGLGRWFKRALAAVADHDAYAFLRHMPGWTAEELALAYALTEPSLATVCVRTTLPTALDRLAKAVERELPNGAAAQIEMARFSTPA